MIPAGYSELRSAFFDHVRIANTCLCRSQNLLLFYSLECGLKSIYLKRNKINRTDRINNKELQKTHDLSLLIKDLKISATTIGTLSLNFRLKRDCMTFSIKSAHEIWRYGIMIQDNDEKALVTWMQAIRKWIEENI